jgi:bacterioferritin
MKGNEQVIACLNSLLADELTAINQYMVHSEMDDNWRFKELHDKVEERAITEMKHAEKLIARIIFLESTPTVSVLRKINIGKDIETQLKNDLEAEYGAVKAYNEGIRVAYDVGDNGSREIMDSILKDEEDHVDYLEAQLDQIKMMGLQTYLVEQVD